MSILSGLGYLLQNFLYDESDILLNDESGLLYYIIRLARMLLLYVVPSILFTYRWGGNWKEFHLFPEKNKIIPSIVFGIMVYSVATYVFLKNEIFFSGWQEVQDDVILKKFFIVACMATITDFWTRGFILYNLSRQYGKKIAIIGENINWFVIHIYEIDLLVPYIGIGPAITLTLFLGIAGDLVALKTESIAGLMLGHILLNLFLILSAKQIIVLF